MKGKLSLIVGFGAGYVLGARAGRDRYDQIAEKALGVWNDPRVQGKAQQAQSLAKEKAAEAAEAAKDAAKEAVSTTVTSVTSSSDDTGLGWPDNADSAASADPATGRGTHS